MFDSLNEIVATIKKNKLRTLLTGFAVAWGVFMLIVLMSAGNGLRNGVMSNLGDQSQNVISLYPGTTSMPSRGLPVGRRVAFDQRDVELLLAQIPEIEYISPQLGRGALLSYGEENTREQISGVSADFSRIRSIKMRKGRFINNIDISDRRKTIVLHPETAKQLFRDEEGVGKQIMADNIIYTVAGIYESRNEYERDSYIPFSTAQMVYNHGWGLHSLHFTINGVDSAKENEAFEARLRGVIGAFHGFDPTDRSALYMGSSFVQAKQFRTVFAIINAFVMLIGVACLMAGIVGVGNIMLVTVKERKREIGIRKALGASPFSVIKLIIFEAIFITTCAGYVGILLGSGVTALVRANFSFDTQGVKVFADPEVEMGTVIGATVFLIACGVVAGLIPAIKTTRIRPIEAMRAE